MTAERTARVTGELPHEQGAFRQWWRHFWARKSRVSKFYGYPITVGSLVRKDNGEQYVALTIQGYGVSLTIDGARMIARQMNEWADIAEQNNKVGTFKKEPEKIVLQWLVTAIDGAEEKREWRHVSGDDLSMPNNGQNSTEGHQPCLSG